MIIIDTNTVVFPASGSTDAIEVTYTGVTEESICAATTSDNWLSVSVATHISRPGVIYYVYLVTAEPNDGEYRTGTVVFRAEGEGLAFVIVNQGSTLYASTPICRDTYFTLTGRTDFEYGIMCGDSLVFNGRAKRAPDDELLSVKMNDIARNWLSIDLDDFSTGMYEHPEAMVKTAITDEAGTPIYQWQFLNQYMDDWRGEDQYNMSEPVNGHLCPRMSAVFTQCNPTPPPTEKYLTFTIESGSGNLGSTKSGVYGRKNDGDWETNKIFSVEAGDVIEYKSTNKRYNESGDTFTASGVTYSVSGNIMSMNYGDDFSGQTTLASGYSFSYLFRGCTGLTDASGLTLPATVLTDGCYTGMFLGCSSLTTTPQLPAMTLAQECYSSMFRDCTSLTTAPNLPATTLTGWCYDGMFEGCSSLTTAPQLPATVLAPNCYYMMFLYCTSLTTAPELPATALAEGCYAGMFWNCTSLTTAPQLPATTLAEGCYSVMFNGCTSLSAVTCLAMTGTDNTDEWLTGVASNGVFTKASGVTWSRGGSGIPNNWTINEI